MTQSMIHLPSLMQMYMDEYGAQCVGSGTAHSHNFGIVEELAARYDLLQPGTLSLIGGRPAMGKTALMLQLAWYSAMVHKPTYLVNLDEPDLVGFLAVRSFSTLTNVPIRFHLYEPKWELLSQDDLSRCKELIHGLPIWVTYRLPPFSDIPCGSLVIVDMVQYVTAKPDWKYIAEKNGISLILLSNLTRSCEHRPDRRPGPRDLSRVRNLGRQADISLFLYRENYYFNDSYAHYNPIAKIYAYRKRHGKPETVLCQWDPDQAKFIDDPAHIHGTQSAH